MQSPDDSLRTQISLGWVIMLLTLVSMLTAMIITGSFMRDDFAALRVDPGVRGLNMLLYFIAAYALMPVYVYLVGGVRSRGFRWAAVVIASFIFLYFMLHHASHWLHGDRPGVSTHVLDVVHHLVAIWVIVNSVRWAKLVNAAAA